MVFEDCESIVHICTWLAVGEPVCVHILIVLACVVCAFYFLHSCDESKHNHAEHTTMYACTPHICESRKGVSVSAHTRTRITLSLTWTRSIRICCGRTGPIMSYNLPFTHITYCILHAAYKLTETSKKALSLTWTKSVQTCCGRTGPGWCVVGLGTACVMQVMCVWVLCEWMWCDVLWVLELRVLEGSKSLCGS